MNRTPYLALVLLGGVVAAHAQLGTNLIVNGDAEKGTTGWIVTGNARSLPYGTSGFPSPSDPGPVDRGVSFFQGGDQPATTLAQSILLPNAPVRAYSLTGYLGGYKNQDDNAVLTLTFLSAANVSLGSATIGPVLAADRANTTGLLLRATTGSIPLGAVSASALLTFTRTFGSDNDGYADNLSFVVAPVPETTSLAALGLGAFGLLRRRRKGARSVVRRLS